MDAFTWSPSTSTHPQSSQRAVMEQVQRALQDYEKDVKQLKKIQSNMDFKIELERSKAEISKLEHEHTNQEHLSEQRAKLDKAQEKELSAHMKKVLSDQRALLARLIAQERATAEETLLKTRESYDQVLKSQRENVDFLRNEARAQVEHLDNERSKMKSLIGNLFALIEQQDIRRNMNFEGLENERSTMDSQIESSIKREDVRDPVEVVRARKNEKVEHGVYIPRNLLPVLMDNECDQRVLMRFKVHIVEERYPDLQKYFDSRENFGQFTIIKQLGHTSVEFVVMLETLRGFGYRGNAELYYLDPTPGSVPSTGLHKIDGQEEVNEMVVAHDIQRTKICHLYLVGPEQEVLDDDMEYYNGDGDDADNYDGEEHAGDMSP